MKTVYKEKYTNTLTAWQQKNNLLIKTIEEYHNLLKEYECEDFKIFKNSSFVDMSLVSKNEVDFVKMLKRLNEIIVYLQNNNDKIIKYELLQAICSAYYCIDGVGTLRLDRIFDKANTEQQYLTTYNMIQQYLRMIEQLINKFKANIIQEKEFDVKGFKL